MNFILLSDIHVTSKTPIGRKDNVLEAFKKKFSFILKYAKKHNAIILQAGDFLDQPRDWHSLYTTLCLLDKYKVPIYTIYGQHDLYMRANPLNTPTSIGILNKLELVNLLNESPTIFEKNIYVYGCSWNSAVPKPTPSKTNILVIHAPITTKKLFPGHKFTAVPQFISKNKGWDLILAGDIHIKTIHKNKTILVNTGPMLRLASTRYNMKHQPCFFFYNTRLRKIRGITIPHKNSKLILSRSHIVKKQAEPELLLPTTLRQFAELLKKKKHYQRPLKRILESLIKKHNTSEKVKDYLLTIMEEDYE